MSLAIAVRNLCPLSGSTKSSRLTLSIFTLKSSAFRSALIRSIPIYVSTSFITEEQVCPPLIQLVLFQPRIRILRFIMHLLFCLMSAVLAFSAVTNAGLPRCMVPRCLQAKQNPEEKATQKREKVEKAETHARDGVQKEQDEAAEQYRRENLSLSIKAAMQPAVKQAEETRKVEGQLKAITDQMRRTTNEAEKSSYEKVKELKIKK